MSGGTVIAGSLTVGGLVGGIGAAAGAVGAVNNLVGGGGSAGGGGTGPGGALNVTQQQYAYHGPHPSTEPMTGQQAPKPTFMTAPKAGEARTATAREQPTQSQGSLYASKDFQGVWADRLSRYLDYNTRNLG